MGLCCLRRSDRQALLHGVDAGSRRLPRRLEQQLQPLPQSADLLHPAEAIMPLDQVATCPRAGKCMHEDGGEIALARGFLARGMAVPLKRSELLMIAASPLVNGWFGIGRGKFLSAEHSTHALAEILRVIMNLTASNTVFLPFAGDIGSLPYIGHWRTIM